MSVQEYIDKHKLTAKIEEAANAAVKAKAEDPTLFISNYMKKLCTPAIRSLRARQILDSRGFPTVEVEITTSRGMFRAASASSASIGIYDAVELRDNDSARFHGKGVSRAVENLNMKIAPVLVGKDPRDQIELDRLMREDIDGTDNKGALGANAIAAASIAICKAGAAEAELPLYRYIADLAGVEKPVLPVPSFSLIDGGSHAGNLLPMQELMVLPIGAKSFSEAMRMGSETYHHLKAVLTESFGVEGCNVGEEGGFAPPIDNVKDGLDLIQQAIDRAGYTGKMKIAMDAAASDFFTDDQMYDLRWKEQEPEEKQRGAQKSSTAALMEVYKTLCTEYPLVSIEDPFEASDSASFRSLTGAGLCQVVGDNSLASNPKRIAQAIEDSACNAVLLNVSQIGTVSEVIEAAKLAREAGWACVASHRCGEVDDAFLADLSAGLASGQVKAGAPCRGERLVKYNQLLRIEEELGDKAVYAGDKWRPKLLP
eukprot:TRINITY_DN19673_c0_g1_i1.p1 TRINITY_DN19673_c0_g1~~TRINITY_DN19673_c0_g1_i1.p1  ORF type:complete len:484 (-),score=106.64 TRINITY_DN19673_c0_g1_i1:236-1687(-)